MVTIGLMSILDGIDLLDAFWLGKLLLSDFFAGDADFFWRGVYFLDPAGGCLCYLYSDFRFFMVF